MLSWFLPPQDEPLTPDDDVERQLRSRKLQSTDDDSAEIEAASFKKFPVEVNSLARVRLTHIVSTYIHVHCMYIDSCNWLDNYGKKYSWFISIPTNGLNCYATMREWVGLSLLLGFPQGFSPSVPSVDSLLVYGMLSTVSLQATTLYVIFSVLPPRALSGVLAVVFSRPCVSVRFMCVYLGTLFAVRDASFS